MTLSQQLSKLADRAAEVEHHVAAAREKSRADLQREVAAAREHTEPLRSNVAAGEEKLAGSWTGVQRSWDEHVAAVRGRLDERRAEHDVKVAARRATEAEDDAQMAADFAYSAVVEAEYAALDATLARMDADRLAQGLTEVAS
jgi:hypothetical protein